VILSLQHITIHTFSESVSQVMHPDDSCVIPTADVSFLVEVIINMDSHSHARFDPKMRWYQKCSSPGRALSPTSKGVKVKMDRQNEVLPTCLKHSEIKTGCFCVIMHNSSATATRDATYQQWNHEAYHPCVLLVSCSVSINCICTQQTSQSNNQHHCLFGKYQVKNIDWQTGYSDWGFLWLYSGYQGKCRDIVLNQAMTTSSYILANLVHIILSF